MLDSDLRFFLFRRRTEFFVNLRFQIDRCKMKVFNFEFSIVGKQLHFVTWQKGHAFLSAVQVQIGCSILHPFKCPHHMRTGERFLSNFPYQVLDQRTCRPKNLELKSSSWKVCFILEWIFGEGGDPSSSQVSFLNWKCLSWRAALWPQGVAQWHFGHALEIVQEKDIFFCNEPFSSVQKGFLDDSLVNPVCPANSCLSNEIMRFHWKKLCACQNWIRQSCVRQVLFRAESGSRCQAFIFSPNFLEN